MRGAPKLFDGFLPVSYKDKLTSSNLVGPIAENGRVPVFVTGLLIGVS
jgi:hypothetical protein